MKRREFIVGSLGLSAWSVLAERSGILAAGNENGQASEPLACCGPTYASPADAMRSPRETLAFVPAIYTGTASHQPDYLATVDVAPDSATYGQVVHRLAMLEVGDELHHFGWNACSSCHGDPSRSRRYLVVPGITSGRIHILDAADPRQVKLHKVIEGREVAEKLDLSAPHTVHCLADGHVMISMLGDATGKGPGGFLLLDDQFNIAGRWERSTEGMHYNYDYWYQPRHNVMVSTEWASPTTFRGGFKPEQVAAGMYGHRIQFWDWQERRIAQTIDLGESGLIPLEVRFHHDPESTHGFVGAALSSSIWHFHKSDATWSAEKIIQVEPVEMAGWPFPVPGLITDLVVSLDDRYLYLSNWLHGDIRQYDISDPSNPRLCSQIWLGGVLGKTPSLRGRELIGGPQMMQLSLDGKRLYVTSSLFSAWDNQFYPKMAERGSFMLQIDCDTDKGSMTVNEDFFVDFGAEPGGPARAHEIRFPGGDSTSDIWL